MALEIDRLVAAGVYDPESPSAAERLELLEYLDELGATTQEMIDLAGVPDALPGLASIAGRPKPTLTLADLAERTGVDTAYMTEIWVALGLGAPAPDEPVVSEDEAQRLYMIGITARILDHDLELRAVRSIGQAISHLAEAMVQTYLAEVEQADATELERARMAQWGHELLSTGIGGLEDLLVRHMSSAAIRLRLSREGERTDSQNTLAIGFVDLVGFTPLSASVGTRELDRLLSDFEAAATTCVTSRGGRLVKLIGDEVMYAAVDVDTGMAIAVALLEALGDDRPDLTPRGGLAYGPVLARSGDYFGPVVNLASRAGSVAVADEILVTEEVMRRAGDPPRGYALDVAGRRGLKGIDEPVPLWSLHRV